jgi:hypothetical protein
MMVLFKMIIIFGNLGVVGILLHISDFTLIFFR